MSTVFTSNKLNRLQFEYKSIVEQNNVLQYNLNNLKAVLVKYNEHFYMQPKGTKPSSDYIRLTRECNNIESTIKRNNMKLSNLERKILLEQQRLNSRPRSRQGYYY